MKRQGIVWILGVMFFSLVGCSTMESPGGKGAFKPQLLNEEEQKRVSRYGELKNGLLVDELRTPQRDEQTLRFSNERMSYEGVFLLRHLGLRGVLDEEESEQFIRAVFERIPTDNPNGAPLRNIVIPRWYREGSPLILQINTTIIQDKAKTYPVILVLLNANGTVIDQFGYKVAQELRPTYTYPRFERRNGNRYLEADGTYLFMVQGNGLVSSSTRTSGELPSLDSAKTIRAKLNLTDSYLRDENPKNDTMVFPVLKEIYEDRKSQPLDRLHAGLQLFLFYLYQQKDDEAEEIAQQLRISTLLEHEGVVRTEIPSIIREDLPFILKVTRGFYR
ncbi:MAG: hypothetical protein N2442_09025 [Spirochaetes bacterium]|nr:hypothetical protein [Spirochaetota bacterium]